MVYLRGNYSIAVLSTATVSCYVRICPNFLFGQGCAILKLVLVPRFTMRGFESDKAAQ